MRTREIRHEALATLENVLNEHFPNIRIGQLIVNIFGNVDLFQIEDSLFKKMVEDYANAERIEYNTQTEEQGETTENETN